MKINVPKFLLILILVSCTSQPSEDSIKTSMAQTVNARLDETATTVIKESPTSMPSEEHEPASKVNIITFNAHQTEIQQGQCTILEWQVEGGYGVELDGKLVDWADDREVCPEETTTYSLQVDSGDRLVDEQVTIQVLESSSEDVDISTESTKQSIPQGSVPTTKPLPTFTPTIKPSNVPNNCYKSSSEYVTDLAITDIYAGNMPKGQFWVRITNNGPVACSNVGFKFLGCATVATPISGGYGIASSDKIPITLNIKPGETQEIPTGIGFDMELATYMVTCHFAAESGYSDLNNSNQYYQENISLPQ